MWQQWLHLSKQLLRRSAPKPVSLLLCRFDKFNLKYNPFGQSRLREIFIKQVRDKCGCVASVAVWLWGRGVGKRGIYLPGLDRKCIKCTCSMTDPML